MHKQTFPEDITNIIWGVVIVFIALAAFIVFIVFLSNNRKNKLMEDKRRMQSEFQQELLQTKMEIQEQTLKTISQEIHDNIGQVLSLAKLNLGTFEPTENKHNQGRIEDTKKLVSKAINDLRHLSRSLYGDKIAELGLRESIANELDILQNTGQFNTRQIITGNHYKIEPQKEIILFRIVQEAIHNAVKHAKAANIYVEMDYLPASFILCIVDDGIGFDAGALQAVETGVGLKNMQSRTDMIGASFSIDSSTGNGTKICIGLKNIEQ